MKQSIPIHQLLFSTVRIECPISDNSSEFGTGFIINYPGEKGVYLFLVTNKHVIEGKTIGKFFFTKRDEQNNPLIGVKQDLEVADFDKIWIFHPSLDLAIAPFVPLLEQLESSNAKVYFKSIPITMIPSKEQLDGLTALEEIIFIGYPNAIYDKKNLLPIIRKGITASPAFLDYEEKPIFLIDASVFKGSSGSPVLIYNTGSYVTPEGNMAIGNRIMFVGVVSSVFFNEENGRIQFIETQKTPVIKTNQFLNLGVVIKSGAIKDMIETYLAQTLRKKIEGEIKT